jgi:(p)ppGpp synthase/HD superfamily hydrolase
MTRARASDRLEGRAAALALEAHAGQVDKQGRDYFRHHLLPIAESLRPYGSHAYVAGLLHDVVEDTSITYQQLAELGFPPVVIEAVRAVTRRDDETYPELIDRAAAHPLGRLVKLADNWHNLSGLAALTNEADRTRLRLRYEQARQVLEQSLITPP